MTETEKDSGNDVTISARIERTGISVGARSRAIASIDRLIGNIFNVPGNYFGGIADRLEARNRLRVKLIEAVGNLAVGEVIDGREVTKTFIDQIIRQDIRKIENKEAIVEKAVEYLSDSRVDDVNRPDQTIDLDWLNLFESFAEQATSDTLRTIWAQVLAGEIRSPNSFSRSTVRAIAELDFETATKFEAALRFRFDQQFIVKPNDLKGEQLIDFTFLEEVGFLQETGGFLGIDFSADDTGSLAIDRGDLLLRVQLNPNQRARLNLVRITRIGQEVAAILPPPNYWAGLKEFGECISANAKSVHLAKVVERLPNKQVRYTDIATIKAPA